MKFGYLNVDSFLRALPVKGFRKIDIIAKALKDYSSFNQEIFPCYWATRDYRLRNALIEVNIPFGKYIASLFSRNSEISFNDYFSQACYVLPNIVEHYKKYKKQNGDNVKFTTYAGKSITYSFFGLLKEQGVIHIPKDLFEFLSEDEQKLTKNLRKRVIKAKKAKTPIRLSQDIGQRAITMESREIWENGNYREKRKEEYFPGNQKTPLRNLLEKEDKEILIKSLNYFGRKGDVIKRSFGIGQLIPETYEDISKNLGISRARVGQLISQSKNVLRDLFKGFEFREGLLEFKKPSEILVCQEFNQLRKYSNMFNRIGGYNVSYVSELEELAIKCDTKDINLCLIDQNMFEIGLDKIIKLTRKSRKISFKPWIIFTYNSLEGKIPRKIRSDKLKRGIDFSDIKDLKLKSHPKRLEDLIFTYGGISRGEIEHSIDRISSILRKVSI
jgi:DNA-directed RNA polymerase specialized sigma subunit